MTVGAAHRHRIELDGRGREGTRVHFISRDSLTNTLVSGARKNRLDTILRSSNFHDGCFRVKDPETAFALACIFVRARELQSMLSFRPAQ